MPRAFQHPPTAKITLDGVLHALADPIRRAIICKLLHADGMSCSQTCDKLPPSTISFHYRVLREAGIVHSQKRGVEVINRLRADDLEKRFPGLLGAILQAE